MLSNALLAKLNLCKFIHSYIYVGKVAAEGGVAGDIRWQRQLQGPHFACFTSTKVQLLTPEARGEVGAEGGFRDIRGGRQLQVHPLQPTL